MTQDTTKLADLECEACSGWKDRLRGPELELYAAEVPHWNVIEARRIERTFRFADFREALEFVNRVGELAERDNHHPDVYLAYGKVRVELYTHKVHGLTPSDFVLAAKIDRIQQPQA